MALNGHSDSSSSSRTSAYCPPDRGASFPSSCMVSCSDAVTAAAFDFARRPRAGGRRRWTGRRLRSLAYLFFLASAAAAASQVDLGSAGSMAVQVQAGPLARWTAVTPHASLDGFQRRAGLSASPPAGHKTVRILSPAATHFALAASTSATLGLPNGQILSFSRRASSRSTRLAAAASFLAAVAAAFASFFLSSASCSSIQASEVMILLWPVWAVALFFFPLFVNVGMASNFRILSSSNTRGCGKTYLGAGGFSRLACIWEAAAAVRAAPSSISKTMSSPALASASRSPWLSACIVAQKLSSSVAVATRCSCASNQLKCSDMAAASSSSPGTSGSTTSASPSSAWCTCSDARRACLRDSTSPRPLD